MMAMQRTEGFVKAVVSVYYTNNEGKNQHMMDFQICTRKWSEVDDAITYCAARANECELDNTKLQQYIQDAIAAVRANDYELTLEFSVQA